MAYYPFAVEKGAFYELVGPDGSIATFNEPSDPNYVGMLTDIAGLESAEVRESAEELTEADGGNHGYFYFARRPVVLTASVFGHASVAERNVRVDRAQRASNAMRGDAVLSWKPSTRQENLSANPGAEVDVSGTSIFNNTGFGSAGTIVRSTTSPIAGAASYEFGWTPDAANPTSYNMYMNNFSGGLTALRAPVVPGRYYAMRWKGKIRAGAGLTGFGGQMAFRNDAATYISGGVAASQATPAVGTVYDFVVNGTVAPAGATWCQLLASINQAAGSTVAAVQFDSILIAEVSGPGVAPPAYFDGDTAGFYWQGNAGLTTSGDFIEMFTTLRRQQRFVSNGNWVKEVQMPMVSEYATLFSTGLKTLSGSPVSAENRGSYTSYPIIEITGVSTNPRVTSSNGGDFRTTGLTLASGEVVQFDMLNHTGVFTAGARNGQSANRYIDYSLTKWIGLPGISTTTVTFTSGGGTLRTIWRDVWA